MKRTLLGLVAVVALVSAAALALDQFTGTLPLTTWNQAQCLQLGDGQATVRLTITGMTSGLDQATVEGGSGLSLTAIPVVNTSSLALASNGVVTADGTYRADVAAYSQVCLVLTAPDAGTTQVKMEASTAPATGGSTSSVTPPPSSTAGAKIACNSAVSPCTISNTAVDVLSLNPSRKGCFLQAYGIVSLCCKRATAAGSAAVCASNEDFVLVGSGATTPGPNFYQCDSPGNIWQGPVNCIATAASAVVDLTVVESQ